MGKILFIFSSKKMPRAFLLALFIILSAHIVEIFVLPINFFTFRIWESLIVHKLGPFLSGPFYPNMTFSMVEEGDLGAHTKFAVKKNVKWETDRFGYRKRNEFVDRYDVVVVGDSDVAGSGLSQEDIFSEQLERASGLATYPFAPAHINHFLYDQRFKDNFPRVVILESIERNLGSLPEIKTKNDHIFLRRLLKDVGRKTQGLIIVCDRISKKIMYMYSAQAVNQAREKLLGYINSLFRDNAEKTQAKKPQSPKKMLFLTSGESIALDKIDGIVQKIKSYKEFLNKRGIRFIFFPLPDKETVYWDELPARIRPVFLKQLIKKLRNEGIEVIDVLGVFENASKNHGILLYHTDDTHWNSNGVRLAVATAMELLDGQEMFREKKDELIKNNLSK